MRFIDITVLTEYDTRELLNIKSISFCIYQDAVFEPCKRHYGHSKSPVSKNVTFATIQASQSISEF